MRYDATNARQLLDNHQAWTEERWAKHAWMMKLVNEPVNFWMHVGVVALCTALSILTINIISELIGTMGFSALMMSVCCILTLSIPRTGINRPEKREVPGGEAMMHPETYDNPMVKAFLGRFEKPTMREFMVIQKYFAMANTDPACLPLIERLASRRQLICGVGVSLTLVCAALQMNVSAVYLAAIVMIFSGVMLNFYAND